MRDIEISKTFPFYNAKSTPEPQTTDFFRNCNIVQANERSHRAVEMVRDRVWNLDVTSVSVIRHTHHESQSNTNKYDRILVNPGHGNLN